jgi:short-subunit dehydrogenase
MAGSDSRSLKSSERVIITGASDGIGKALALEFASRKISVGLLARRLELLEAVKKECLARGSPQAFVAANDITDEPALEAALEKLDSALDGCTIFIANAGVTGRSCFDENAWKKTKFTLSVNVMATIHSLEFMKVKMLKRLKIKPDSGAVPTLCGVSSVAAARGMPTTGAYSTSKAALTTHLEVMRLDLKSHGISVVTVAPGFIDTAITKQNKGTMPFLAQPDEAAKIFVDGILKRKVFIVAPRPYRLIYPVLQMMPRSIFGYVMGKIYKSIRDYSP